MNINFLESIKNNVGRQKTDISDEYYNQLRESLRNEIPEFDSSMLSQVLETKDPKQIEQQLSHVIQSNILIEKPRRVINTSVINTRDLPDAISQDCEGQALPIRIKSQVGENFYRIEINTKSGPKEAVVYKEFIKQV